MKRLLTLLTFLVAAPAFSQGFEAGRGRPATRPRAGSSRRRWESRTFSSRAASPGASAGYFFSPRFGVEASWTRQGSELKIGTAQGSAELFDVTIDQVQGSFVYQLGGEQSRLRPFFTAGAGAAFFSATDLAGETKLSLRRRRRPQVAAGEESGRAGCRPATRRRT